MRFVSSFCEVASVWVMPCRVEIPFGDSVAIQDVLELVRAPKDVSHGRGYLKR